MDPERIGKYEIVGELGRGTMGQVYKAHDPVLNRHVALKTLSVHIGPGEEAYQRFQREAQAAALLNHPNIVTVHDFGQEERLLYMAMELLEGTDLRDAIDHDLLKTLDEKLDVMDGLLAALDYAHSKGVIHRDVKPANIHLGPERQVKIMDFGLARVGGSEITQDGIVLGTPNYMSPEQALGDRVDPRSDLFSAGAVLYELLTGHKPFEADSTPSVLFQVVHKEAPPVRRWAPDAPAPLVAIVERALRKDRRKRFATAAEMRAALAGARLGAAALPAADGSLAELIAPAATASGSGRTSSSRPEGGRGSGPRLAGSPAGLRPAPRRPRGPRVRLFLVLTTALLAIIALSAGALWWWPGLWPEVRSVLATPRPDEADEKVGALTEALVTTQLQLAQRELENKNYAAAVEQAHSALRLSTRNPEGIRILGEARRRLRDLDAAVENARRLTERGEMEEASQQLSKVLELDPRHPAASELSAALNSAFQARAQQAAASARASREQAAAAGAGRGSDFETAAGIADAAEGLVARGEFAQATRTFLEARDAFDRARRAARTRRAAQPEGASTPAPAGADAAAAVTGERASAGSEPASPASDAPQPSSAPPRGFTPEGTKIATPSAGGPEGFDNEDVSTLRTPEFSGQIRFEVEPPTVRPGDSFVVRIHVVNAGRRPVRVRSLSLATLVDGRRVGAPVKTLGRLLAAQQDTLVAEYSGVWHGVSSWALEAVVTSDREETISSRLRSE